MDALINNFGLVSFIIVIFSIVIHEVAHGYVAYLFGDGTAYRAGRLTLNPLPHVDIFGSVIIPLLGVFAGGSIFGWAKPVPVDLHNISSRAGHTLVAAAGVLANLTLAVIAFLLAKFGAFDSEVVRILLTVLFINVSLAFFNLIPIPPFDGMSILQGIFPRLTIRSTIIYNPLYMLFAIIVASTLFGIVGPPLFSFVQSLFF